MSPRPRSLIRRCSPLLVVVAVALGFFAYSSRNRVLLAQAWSIWFVIGIAMFLTARAAFRRDGLSTSATMGLAGLAIVEVGTAGYFLFSAKHEALRAVTWPNWVLVGLGLLLAGCAAFRRRVVLGDRIGAVLCLVIAGFFAWRFAAYTLWFSHDLPPPTAESLELGRALPDLELQASDGTRANLLDESRAGPLRGRKLVLSFFRGFW